MSYENKSYVLISGLAAAHDQAQGIHDLSGDAELADRIGKGSLAIDRVLHTYIHTYINVYTYTKNLEHAGDIVGVNTYIYIHTYMHAKSKIITWTDKSLCMEFL